MENKKTTTSGIIFVNAGLQQRFEDIAPEFRIEFLKNQIIELQNQLAAQEKDKQASLGQKIIQVYVQSELDSEPPHKTEGKFIAISDHNHVVSTLTQELKEAEQELSKIREAYGLEQIQTANLAVLLDSANAALERDQTSLLAIKAERDEAIKKFNNLKNRYGK